VGCKRGCKRPRESPLRSHAHAYAITRQMPARYLSPAITARGSMLVFAHTDHIRTASDAQRSAHAVCALRDAVQRGPSHGCRGACVCARASARVVPKDGTRSAAAHICARVGMQHVRNCLTTAEGTNPITIPCSSLSSLPASPRRPPRAAQRAPEPQGSWRGPPRTVPSTPLPKERGAKSVRRARMRALAALDPTGRVQDGGRRRHGRCIFR
jgi:hypothetical protein